MFFKRIKTLAFFFLFVYMRFVLSVLAKSFRKKIKKFKIALRKKMLPFLFLFAHMRFVFFVPAKCSRKKIKRFKIALMTSFSLLLKSALKKILSVKLILLI